MTGQWPMAYRPPGVPSSVPSLFRPTGKAIRGNLRNVPHLIFHKWDTSRSAVHMVIHFFSGF